MIRYQKDTENIVTLTLDMQGRRENLINHEIWENFVPVIRQLQQEKSQGILKGVILTSAKPSFLAGGDFEYLYQLEDPEEIFASAQQLKGFLRDLERPGVPVVAAINGNALGPGFELALACHHRIMLKNSAIRVGLPEVSLGLIPGGGGIIRLMWLMGIRRAWSILASGKAYVPREALRKGLVDELADHPRDMMEKARRWLLQNKEGRRPWDQPDERIPDGDTHKPEIADYLRQRTAELSTNAQYNYPAQLAIINVLTEGSRLDFDTACRVESRLYTELVRSKACKNMLKAHWFDRQFIQQGKNRPKGFGKFRPKKAGIIGAGRMGSGIALACLLHGLEVVIKDVSRLVAERGRDFLRRQLGQLVQNGQLEEGNDELLLAKVTTTENAADFASCDLVIEAVFENANVKKKVTREAAAHLDEYAIFGTNTLSIPITELAGAVPQPEQYVGLHFFHPAQEVPLVEIVKGEKSSDEAIAKAFDFVRAIEKIPIVVKDDWGFYAARVQNTYLLEGITMLQEGYPAAYIENIGRKAGMPDGPLALADRIGLPIVLSYERQAAAHYGKKYLQHPAVQVLETMVEKLDRPGISKGAGFYDYAESERKLWPELPEHFQPVEMKWNSPEASERFLFAQVLEALWCMQEGVIRSVPAANLGSIYGWGFPAFKGGVIQFIDDYGLDAFHDRCKEFQERFGPRFRMPRRLRELVEVPA